MHRIEQGGAEPLRSLLRCDDEFLDGRSGCDPARV